MSFSYIRLHSGKIFDYINPDINSIDIGDIAFSLSHINRYFGHVGNYSVAEHSVRVSRILSPQYKFAGLIHDFAESYIGDCSSPLKKLLPDYKIIEERVERVVCEKFGVDWPMRSEVKTADMILLATELRDLCVGADYKILEQNGYYPLKDKIIPWTAKRAEKELLKEYYKLIELK